ncbi:hypothetical protein GPALN_006115 [Globodera pallida]|nr:hypothetical protein GPALN_006115 [Globodera pallida]
MPIGCERVGWSAKRKEMGNETNAFAMERGEWPKFKDHPNPNPLVDPLWKPQKRVKGLPFAPLNIDRIFPTFPIAPPQRLSMFPSLSNDERVVRGMKEDGREAQIGGTEHQPRARVPSNCTSPSIPSSPSPFPHNPDFNGACPTGGPNTRPSLFFGDRKMRQRKMRFPKPRQLPHGPPPQRPLQPPQRPPHGPPPQRPLQPPQRPPHGPPPQPYWAEAWSTSTQAQNNTIKAISRMRRALCKYVFCWKSSFS